MQRRTKKSEHHQAQELGSLISRARRRIFQAVARQLDVKGESVLVWQVLNSLRLDGPLSQCELAHRTGQHPAGVSRLLYSLEKEHSVCRTRDKSDRRRLRVDLTGKARSRLKAMDPDVAVATEQALMPLRTSERRHLRDLLAKLTSA